MAPDLSLVTVTFGDTLAATRVGTGLDALQRTGGEPLMEVIVVAVGSEGRAAADEMAERLRPASLDPMVVELDSAAGYARAANAGVAKASADIVVAAKPEVTFHQRFLLRLRQEAAEPWDFLAPAVRVGESKPDEGVTRRGRGHRMVPAQAPREPGAVQAGEAACVIVRRPALERRTAAAGGLFEEEYGSGCEDLDLFWWAERNGLVVRYVPTLYVGKAVGQETAPDAADRRREMSNYRVTVWKHAVEPRDWLGWAIGEASYLGEEITSGRLNGLERYGRSWVDSVRTARDVKRRRGRLRTDKPGS